MWSACKKMYYKYGTTDTVYSMTETSVRAICSKLINAHNSMKLNLPVHLTELIRKNFRTFKFYEFADLEKNEEDEYINFDYVFYEFSPQEMGYILTMNPNEDYQFFPTNEDSFCAISEWYEDSSGNGYCRSCAGALSTLNEHLNILHDTNNLKYFKFKHFVEHENIYEKSRAFEQYIFNQEMWCANCANTSLFMFCSADACRDTLHNFKRKNVYFK